MKQRPARLGQIGLLWLLVVGSFTFAGGVETYLLPLGTWETWVFLVIAGCTVLPAGRLLTTYVTGWANEDSADQILKGQRNGSMVVGGALALSLAVTVLLPDEFRQIYIIQAVLGISTGGYALYNLVRNREPLTRKSSRVVTVPVLVAVAISLALIGLDFWLIATGSRGVAGLDWLFNKIPELATRGLVSLSYDVVATYVAYFLIASRQDATGWEKHGLATRAFLKGAPMILGFLWLGPFMGQWIATGGSFLGWNLRGFAHSHPALSPLVAQLLGQFVIATAISSPVGAVGVTWESGLKRHVFVWMSGLKTHVLAWIKSWIGITTLEAEVAGQKAENERLQNRVTTLETKLGRVNDDLRRTREIFGLPALESKVRGVTEPFTTDMESLKSETEETFRAAQGRLDQIERRFSQSNLTADQLLEVARSLQRELQQIESRGDENTQQLNRLHQRAMEELGDLLTEPLLADWLATQSYQIEEEARSTTQVIGSGARVLRRRGDRLVEQCGEQMSALRARLLAEADEGTQRAAERSRQAEALEQEMDDLS